MLTRKNSVQKNVSVDMSMYTKREIEELLTARVICWLDDRLEQHYEMPDWWKYDETIFSVFLEDTKEIKVIYNKESGFYYNVVVLKDTGKEIYINL